MVPDIPRFELHLDAAIPHSKDVVDPVALTLLLNEFEERLEKLGATVTINMARTNRTEVPDRLEDMRQALAQATRDKGGPSPGQYL